MCPNRTTDVLTHLLDADVDETAIRAMRARERRYVLYYLLEHERASVTRLAAVVTNWLADDGEATEDETASTAVALSHSHLPRLDDAGLATYDRDCKQVSRTDLSGPVRDALQVAYLAEQHALESPDL